MNNNYTYNGERIGEMPRQKCEKCKERKYSACFRINKEILCEDCHKEVNLKFARKLRY